MGLAGRIALLGVVLFGCDDPTPKADPPEPIVLPPHVPGEYPGPCLAEEGLADEGLVGRVIVTTKWGYDAQGRNTLYDQQTDDGLAHRRETTFDAQGRELETDEFHGLRPDDLAFPESWTRHHYTYDASGRQVRHAADIGRDGSIDAVFTQRWDLQGHVIEARGEHVSPETPDTVRLSTYDAEGNLTRWVSEDRWPAHAGNSARVERTIQEFVYIDGEFVEMRIDNGDDGVIDYREARTFDDVGRLVEHWRDEDGDGRQDWRLAIEYAQGSAVATTEFYAAGHDHPYERTVVITSDNGSRRERRSDHDADGVFESIVFEETGDTGRTVRSDLDGDGTVDDVREWVWAPGNSNRHLRATVDRDADGIDDEIQTWRYGPHGVEEWRKVDANGEVLDYELRTYDDFGNFLDSTSPDRSWKQRYICPWSPFER